MIGGCALGFATGWNIANTGSVAGQLAGAYGVGLAAIGLFTTALFITHAGMQIPAGRAADRFGARRTGMVALTLIADLQPGRPRCTRPGPRARGPTAHRCRHGARVHRRERLRAQQERLGLRPGHLRRRRHSAAAVSRSRSCPPPQPGSVGGLRSRPPSSSLSAAWRCSRAGRRTGLAVGSTREAHVPSGVVRDARLYKLAVLFSFSLGLSVVLGNWVATLLQREGGMSRGAAGVIAALTLVLGVASRPLGGWILHTRPGRIRAAVGASLVAGALGSLAVAAATPPALTVVGAMLIGVAAGIPFAPTFQGAARLRPDAQAAAVGFVNGAASLVILVGTPLLGLAFSLPGGGRAGFVVSRCPLGARAALLPSAHALGRRAQTRARIAFRMISAASAASAGSASSSGVWLMPSRHGTKTIALGTRSATHIVSCAAPEACSMNGSPVASGRFLESAPRSRASSGVAASVWRSGPPPSSPVRSAARRTKSRARVGDSAVGLLDRRRGCRARTSSARRSR